MFLYNTAVCDALIVQVEGIYALPSVYLSIDKLSKENILRYLRRIYSMCLEEHI